MVRPSASYVMSRVVAMGAPYRPPVARHTGGHAREPWSAAAIGIGRRWQLPWRRRWCWRPADSGGHRRRPRPARRRRRPRRAAPPPPRRPRPPAPARCTLGAPIALPFSADRVTAAESPDGAVFAAPQDPTSPSPSVAWVIDGNGPALDRRARADRHRRAGRRRHQLLRGDVLDAVRLQPHEREPGRAVDDAAGADGEQLEQRSRRAGGGQRHRLRLGDAGQHGQRVHPQPGDGDGAAPAPDAGWATAVGSDGSVYYERTDHHLAARRPNGATSVGPVLADKPNGLGGGVQYVDVVAGGAVWVSEPAGQGLDATFTTYDAATLHHARVVPGLGDEHRGGLQRRRAWRSSRPAATRPARRRRRPRRPRASSTSCRRARSAMRWAWARPSRCSARTRRSSRRTPARVSSTCFAPVLSAQ